MLVSAALNVLPVPLIVTVPAREWRPGAFTWPPLAIEIVAAAGTVARASRSSSAAAPLEMKSGVVALDVLIVASAGSFTVPPGPASIHGVAPDDIVIVVSAGSVTLAPPLKALNE